MDKIFIQFLAGTAEEEGIISEIYFKELKPSKKKNIKVSKHAKTIRGEEIEAIFETNLETQEITLKNAWVKTKK